MEPTNLKSNALRDFPAGGYRSISRESPGARRVRGDTNALDARVQTPYTCT